MNTPLNNDVEASSTNPTSTSATDAELTKDEQPKICLDQFLKTCGVETGGQAKRLIQGGEVLVNNETETRRRRKLVPGDEVQLYEDIFIVALAEPEPEAEPEPDTASEGEPEPDTPSEPEPKPDTPSESEPATDQ